MLTRENQMLKLRIRELGMLCQAETDQLVYCRANTRVIERQLSELNPTASITHSPVTSSGLMASPALSSTRATQGTSEGSEA
jgi:hypothetical protein